MSLQTNLKILSIFLKSTLSISVLEFDSTWLVAALTIPFSSDFKYFEMMRVSPYR